MDPTFRYRGPVTETLALDVARCIHHEGASVHLAGGVHRRRFGRLHLAMQYNKSLRRGRADIFAKNSRRLHQKFNAGTVRIGIGNIAEMDTRPLRQNQQLDVAAGFEPLDLPGKRFRAP